jgi:hypothetical protein
MPLTVAAVVPKFIAVHELQNWSIITKEFTL